MITINVKLRNELKTFELPMDMDTLKEELKDNIPILEDLEFHTNEDFSQFVNYDEGAPINLIYFNEVAELLQCAKDNYELENMFATLECGYTIKDFIEDNVQMDNFIFITLEDSFNEDEALGIAMAELVGLDFQLEDLGIEFYFDYEKYGRDYRLSGNVFIASNNIAILM